MEFLSKLFDTSDFPDRWNCGHWTDFHGWLHILSDLAVFGAYTALPCVIIFFVLQRKDLQFPNLFWLFCAFIFACGTTHLIEAIIFWMPIYRFAGVMKLVTAIVSWATVFALIRFTPAALRLPTQASLNEKLELEAETLRQTQTKLTDALTNLQKTKSLNDAIVQNVGNGIILLSAIKTPEILNPRAKEILGPLFDFEVDNWTESKGVFKSDGETLCTLEDLPFTRAMRGDFIQGEEFFLRSEDQNSKWVRVTTSQVPSDENQDFGVIVIFDDITLLRERRAEMAEKQRETSTELSLTNRRMDRVLNSIADVVWRGESDKDNQFQFTYLSPAIEILTGQPATFFMHDFQNWAKAIHAEDRQQVMDTIWNFVGGSQDFIFSEYRVVHQDGSIHWIRNRVQQSRNEDGGATFHGIMAEFTNEKHAKDALIRSERLASIGSLAAGFAHEINNPLGAVMLSTERAINQIKNELPKEQIAETLTRSLDSVDRCKTIVKNVLRFANQQPSEKAPHSITTIATSACDLILFKAKKKQVSISLKDNASEPEVVASPTQIEQLLLNLLSNAIDSAPQNSEIKMIIDATAENVSVSVHDSGLGMSAETKQKACDPFFSNRSGSVTTGLGLTIAQTIVTDHGGTIHFNDSNLLSGAVVSIELPRSVE